MQDQNIKTLADTETVSEMLSSADAVFELGDVGDTKGGFGGQVDGHGGFFNPDDL